MSQISSRFESRSFEGEIYCQWEKSGAFSPPLFASSQGKPYVIMLPPPNITGSLHMGHALQDTIIDILVRYHRMKGEPVLWVPGIDHAALPTNKIIVDQLAAEQKTPSDIGRQAFLARAQRWYAETGAQIINQMKRLGVSADWTRNRFTLDDAYYQAVQEAFIRYHAKGYIYRGARIVNWDPATQTTVSDLEIEYKTEKAPHYYFQYGPFEISTARPETKFGDKYVVMHPNDARYSKYKHGDKFNAEWINGPVTATIIKDKAADPAVGSGVMTISPWHAVADFDIAQRHELDVEQIIDFHGRLLPVAGEFSGQSISAARPKIVAKLEKKGLLIRVIDHYEHNIALNDRGKGVIEPQVMRQWFLKMNELAPETIAVVENEIIRFVPSRWKKHVLTWLADVRDWNINRQIWLGHRIPVWWKPGAHGTNQEEGNYVVSIEKPGGEYEQDPDVLDTWFSSALWPFAALGWPRQSAARQREMPADLDLYYPTSVLVTAREILYLWVARMIFSGLELMQGFERGERSPAQRIPFRDVFIHPVVLAKDGRRMSKSLGTGVDPLLLIDKYGADAIRIGLMLQVTYDAQAIKFDEEAIKSGRNFANKIWNIARLLQSASLSAGQPSIADQWIENRFNAVRDQYYENLNAYKFGEAARLAHSFFRNNFADWYLEILKHEGSRAVAQAIFIESLKLLHPIMPYITEVLWQNFGQDGLLISAPLAQPLTQHGPDAGLAMLKFQDLVSTIRRARSLLNFPAHATMAIWVEQSIMPVALAALTKADLALEQSGAMLRFPLARGGYVGLASRHITAQNLVAARAKLDSSLADLNQRRAQLQKLLATMANEAPVSIIKEKKMLLQQIARQTEAMERARDALARHDGGPP